MTDYERNADVSKTLTEQWKQGVLEHGWYYINSGSVDYKYSKYNSADFFVTPHEDIKEVLAPVPSYEEWQKMKEQRDACSWALDKIGDVLVNHKLVKKIDNATGEK